MSTTTTHAEVTAYVTRVRTHLADLGPEVVEELTGGLEADLTDSLESQPVIEGVPALTPEALFGDPALYAAELRSSAGLPPAAATAWLPIGSRERFRRSLDGVVEPIRLQPWWPAVRDFFVEIRPAWWVLRGLVVGVLLARALGGWFFGTAVLGGLGVVLSVELGRRLRAGRMRSWRVPVVVANVLLLLAIPVGGLFVVDAGRTYDDGSGYVDQNGAIYNREGAQVTNVFPYGADGKPLTGVRLYDQDGVPISAESSATHDDAQGMSWTTVPSNQYGIGDYSVYPLREQPMDALPGEGVQDPTPPLAVVPALPAPIAASPTAVAVPDLVGRGIAEARQALQDAGLVIDVSPPGDVVESTVPAAGTNVAPGTVVHVTLATP